MNHCDTLTINFSALTCTIASQLCVHGVYVHGVYVHGVYVHSVYVHAQY